MLFSSPSEIQISHSRKHIGPPGTLIARNRCVLDPVGGSTYHFHMIHHTMPKSILFILTTFSFFFGGCSDSDNTGQDGETIGLESIEKGECLQFTALDGSAVAPSNVTLFFTLETCGDRIPVLGVAAENFELLEGGKPVSPFESHFSILPKCIGYDLLTVLLLDLSGSVFETESLEPLVEAAKTFASNLSAEEHYISIRLFDGRPVTELLIDFTKDKESLLKALDSVLLKSPVDTSTNLNGAVVDAMELLDEKNLDSKALLFKGSLVIFTDGTDQAGLVEDSVVRDVVTASLHSSYTIGLGGEVDTTHLEALGKSGSFLTASINELGTAFEESATEVLRTSQNYYVVGYCSPKRAGTHQLQLSVTGYTGVMNAEFDASDFETGCDAQSIVSQAELDAKACAVPAPWEAP